MNDNDLLKNNSFAVLRLGRKSNFLFILYVIYIFSFFLRIPARLPFLGAMRFDLILVSVISFLVLMAESERANRLDRASKYLIAIFAYSFISLPLVEWPGSVINNGMIAFFKGAIFYFLRLGWLLILKD